MGNLGTSVVADMFQQPNLLLSRVCVTKTSKLVDEKAKKGRPCHFGLRNVGEIANNPLVLHGMKSAAKKAVLVVLLS